MDAAISTVLYYDDTAETWGADMGFADYLATTSMGSSQLELTISNPEDSPSSDLHDVVGRIEYSALGCGETECPFYLANLTLSNTTDTWALLAGVFGDGEDVAVHINNITVQLRRPTLGVWNTSTNQVYVGKERIDLYVMVTHQIGLEPPVEGAYLVTNVDAIFGELDAAGAIWFLDLVVDDGSDMKFEADLLFDTVAGHPPMADAGMDSTVIGPDVGGLPVSFLTDSSSDPDHDIDSKSWFVDGVERSSPYVIPVGSHELALRVIDQRGATDVDESIVEVLSP